MMFEPDEIPDIATDGPLDLTGDARVDAWRGVAAEEVESRAAASRACCGAGVGRC